MNKIKNKLLVMSGKGGVGKTTIAVNLTSALAIKGKKVGILDVDIHGPNVPKMLKLEDKKLSSNSNKIIPLTTKDNIKVVSMAFLIQKSDAVIWRGPMKHNVIKQFIEDVDWGELDYLVIDFPPGSGDECISISQLLKDITGSIIITTPQKISLIDVVRSIDFCKKVNIPIIGVIENMSGDIFGRETAKDFAVEHNVDYLGSLEIDKEVSRSGDSGVPFVNNNYKLSKDFNKVVDKIISYCKK